MDIADNSFEMDISLLTPVKLLEMDTLSPDIHTDLTCSMEEDMDTSDVATSSVKFNMQPPTAFDEDSGLGMTPMLTTNEVSVKKDADDTNKAVIGYGARRSLFRQKRCFDGDLDGSITKRHRRQNGSRQSNRKCSLKKSLSFGNDYSPPDVDLKSAVDRLAEDDYLIGNGSKIYTLPTIPGKHTDLKSITSETMVDILLGRYDDVIGSFRIIDCRYPYEYNGGHIEGAENLYTRDQIMELLQSRTSANNNTREILIFHCEFSSERGPKMSRFLRSSDRNINSDRYPFLHFPEVYLLHDGYKAFYESHKELCEPMSYTPMHHSNHTSDLRHFRAKSKSWSVNDLKQRTTQRLCF